MKNLLVTLFVFIVLTVTQTFAYEARQFSTDTKIVAALNLLEQAGETDVFANLKKNAVKIKFYNLSYGNVYAANTYDNTGRRVILINSIYENAPVEQIACLIAHESQHHTFTNTRVEELRAWISETQAWSEFTKRNQELAQSNEPLAKRENVIAKIRAKGGVQGIQKLIATNPVYAELN